MYFTNYFNCSSYLKRQKKLKVICKYQCTNWGTIKVYFTNSFKYSSHLKNKKNLKLFVFIANHTNIQKIIKQVKIILKLIY